MNYAVEIHENKNGCRLKEGEKVSSMWIFSSLLLYNKLSPSCGDGAYVHVFLIHKRNVVNPKLHSRANRLGDLCLEWYEMISIINLCHGKVRSNQKRKFETR